MSVVLQCSRCGREMHSSGLRGLCPHCLFACTTERLSKFTETSEPKAEGVLESGASAGPNGRFLLVDKLGEGAMGQVWLANDQELSQEGEPHLVALKFLSESIQRDPQALATVRAEVLRTQKLSHPNIVRIFDLHTTRAGVPFIKMEFVEGNSLSQWLEQRPDHVMPWRMLVRLAQQLADALRYAHETAGIVHRDLKPSNLLLGAGMTLKLSDFGIAQAIQDPAGATGTAEALGTLWYASPQQIAGQHPTPADDVYAFGATLYELMTGTPPFEGESAEEIIQKIYHETPEPIPQRLRALGRENVLPAKLLILVQSCLDKNPFYRPETHQLIRLLSIGMDAPFQSPPGVSPRHSQWETELASPKSSGTSWGWLILIFLLGAGFWLYLSGVLSQWFPTVEFLRNTAKKPAAVAKEGARTEERAPSPESQPPSVPQLPDSGITPSKNRASPTATEHHGQLQIVIKPVNDKTTYPHEYTLNGPERQSVTYSVVPGSRYSQVHTQAPGIYTVTVKLPSQDNWTMQESVEIKPDQTTNVTFQFVWEAQLTVTTDPPRARVWWRDQRSTAWKTNVTEIGLGFTERLKSGAIEFTAKKFGHHPVTTNYQFNPAKPPALHLLLAKSSWPLPGENWTNSLGMAFEWIAPLALWACATETRVADFRRFVEAAHHDAKQGMYDPSVDGTKPTKNSWENPGPDFQQTDQHPVVGINWSDANEFCKWLTQVEWQQKALNTNQAYRLPRTNQWFELARGREINFASASDLKALAGNFAGQDGFPRTAPVRADAFKPNAYDLYHLWGNAAEWCFEEVLCGGSWFDAAVAMGEIEIPKMPTPTGRATVEARPERRDARYGFRVLIVPADAAQPGRNE